MEVIITPDPEAAAERAARIVSQLIAEKPDAVLGLATGSTPLPLYRKLAELHRAGRLDFSRVTTFNLDEYLGLAPEHPCSYHSFMREHFFDHVNVAKDRFHIPDGLTENVPEFCRSYDEAIRVAGGIDLQVLGIGKNGHIGFNEPSSSLASRTRIKTLSEQTIRDNARFFGSDERVPRHVITMGVGTILESRRCILMAFGESKAQAVARMVEGPLTAMVPASALQWHPKVHVFVDEAAASLLSRSDYYRWVYDHKPDP